jgi:hypothetical protein
MAIPSHPKAIKHPHVTWWFSLADVALFPLFTLWFIWRLQFIARWSWITFVLWLITSFAVHGDTPKALGWRLNNLWLATHQALKAFLPLIFGMIAIGFVLHGQRDILRHLLSPRRFADYCAFCLLQQVALNSLIQNRMLRLVKNDWVASTLSGVIFGVMHWPNPVLAPATFIVGTIMTYLFAKHRNILPLAVGQALLGTIAGWAFPSAWIHHLRVGPGYYT